MGNHQVHLINWLKKYRVRDCPDCDKAKVLHKAILQATFWCNSCKRIWRVFVESQKFGAAQKWKYDDEESNQQKTGKDSPARRNAAKQKKEDGKGRH